MHPSAFPAERQSEMEMVYRLYAGLASELDPQKGLGGKLLYAGELDNESSRLVRAANIAGAASLSVTADATAQRQAIREGVVDFLVMSLDEALRILKNEIRKRNAVAVGVTGSAARVAEEMRERGVLPDLVWRPASPDGDGSVEWKQVRAIVPVPLPEGCEFRIFDLPPADFDARVLALLPESDYATRRWLRLSPRYLGPQARRMRALPCDAQTAAVLNPEP